MKALLIDNSGFTKTVDIPGNLQPIYIVPFKMPITIEEKNGSFARCLKREFFLESRTKDLAVYVER